MSQLIPFNDAFALPAYLSQDALSGFDPNKDVITAPAFPSMSIRGKRFTLNRDGVKKVLTKPDDPEEVAQSIGVIVVRANMNAKVFYIKKYAEGESDGAQPDCYSYDGQAPSSHARNPQAKSCGACPHNVWGSRISDAGEDGEKKGKACADNARLAISPVGAKLDPMLLRVPPASLKALREAVKLVNTRKLPYNSVVMKVGFDIEASSPKLTFKPVAVVDEAVFKAIRDESYESELVRAIVGVDDSGVAPVEDGGSDRSAAAELDEAIAARDAAKAQTAPEPAPAPEPPAKKTKAAKPAPEPAPAPKAAPEPAPEPAPAPKAVAASDLLSDMASLLGSLDD